jgi:hypothetical protein
MERPRTGAHRLRRHAAGSVLGAAGEPFPVIHAVYPWIATVIQGQTDSFEGVRSAASERASVSSSQYSPFVVYPVDIWRIVQGGVRSRIYRCTPSILAIDP